MAQRADGLNDIFEHKLKVTEELDSKNFKTDYILNVGQDSLIPLYIESAIDPSTLQEGVDNIFVIASHNPTLSPIFGIDAAGTFFSSLSFTNWTFDRPLLFGDVEVNDLQVDDDTTINNMQMNGDTLAATGVDATFSTIQAASSQVTDDNSTNVNTENLTATVSFDIAGISNGNYSPSISGTANVASVAAYSGQYIRVGNAVNVSGRLNFSATVPATLTTISISLPVASNFASYQQCCGTAVSPDIAGLSGAIRADASNDVAELAFFSIDTNSYDMFFNFTYQII